MKVRLLYIKLIVLILLWGCQNDSAIPEALIPIRAEIKLKAPEGLVAGNDILLLVATEVQKNIPVVVLLENGLTSKTYNAWTNKKLKIPGTELVQSGVYNIWVLDNDNIIAGRKLRIRHGEIVEPLEIYTGPNSIISGGKQSSMVTAIPSDEYDNAITEKQIFTFQSNEAKGLISRSPVENLFASMDFASGVSAQKVMLGISQNDLASNEQTVYEIADWPDDFQIELVDHYPYADNRQYCRLRTDRIVDEHGNQVADGTMVTFMVSKADVHFGNYQSIIIDGVANVYIKNPAVPGKLDIKAFIGDYAHSNILSIGFDSNIQEITYSIDNVKQTITVGPLKSALGQFVPDGTQVIVKAVDKEQKKETLDGLAVLDLGKLGTSGRHQVTIIVNGLTKTVSLK